MIIHNLRISLVLLLYKLHIFSLSGHLLLLDTHTTYPSETHRLLELILCIRVGDKKKNPCCFDAYTTTAHILLYQ